MTGSLIVGVLAAGATYLVGKWVGSIAGGRELRSGDEISGVDPEYGNHWRGSIYKEDSLPSTVYLPFFALHLGSIFAGDILLFDVNFFEDKKPLEATDELGNKVYYLDKNDNGTYESDIDAITSTSSATSQLRGIVSSWYYRLRTIAIIASMLILIYIGIRIILSSVNPNGKAKYKNMLMDWLISICLLFCMHYIMLFSVKIVEYATGFINSVSNEGGTYMVMIETNGIMEDNLEEAGFSGSPYFVDGSEIGINGNLFSFPTNMFGYIRVMSQFTVGFTYVGYAVIYIICVLFILFFTFTYLRRVVYMAFLTIISPLVALSYPIDKINDGSAQAFNMWFKEYIFNLLIQPMHMILYYILISSAFELASENFIYAIVAICFMVPAEKMARRFFGFDKAQTPGLLAGAGGAALVMSGIKGLNRFARGDKGRGPGGKDSKENDKSPRFKQTGTFDELAEEGQGDSEEKEPKQQDPAKPDPDPANPDPSDQNPANINTDPGPINPDPDNQDPASPALVDPYQYNPEGYDGEEPKYSTTGDTIYTGRESKDKKISKKRAFARVVGRRTLVGGKKLLASAGRTGVKVAGGAALGIAGAIVGGATGDIKNVMSYATAGGAVGSTIGERVANDIAGSRGRMKDFRQEVANETNDDAVRNEYATKQFMKDKEIRKIYEQKLGIKGPDKKKQIDEAMKNALKYKEYGVKDDKIIADAMKEQGLGDAPTDRKRIMAAKIAEKVNGSQKTLEDQMKALKERRGYSQEQINRIRHAVANIDGNITG
ncbi:MAG: hypothetical protein HFJ48_06215 [Clostridia bacterium]|nr:hypothetical protein [Clostridia bacterium]